MNDLPWLRGDLSRLLPVYLYDLWRNVIYINTHNNQVMADSLALRDFWKSFAEMKTKLLKNISILSLIMVPITYQVISVEFFVEEEATGACNYSG